jgi:NADH-quinone oxidoreductase subunit N
MPAYYLEALTVTLGIILLMAEAFCSCKSKAWVGIAAAIGLTGIFGLLFISIGPGASPTSEWAKWPMWNFYQFDNLAKFYKGFALICTILVLLMSVDFRKVLSRFTENPESESGTGEYYALPIFACAGMMWLASAKDLAGAFVALELITVTFYILVGFMRRNVGSLEAGVKYLIVGALSTGFLVYGIAWVYGATHTMACLGNYAVITPDPANLTGLLFGIALVLVGIGFKVGAVPMHIWIPDVYQGAPTPTTAFLSVGSKAAGFVLLIRFIEPFLKNDLTRGPILTILLVLACATLLFGNLAAIPQTNFKRLLAYSAIAHAGYLLLALAAWHGSDAIYSSAKVVSFYLGTYLLMTLGAFFVLCQIRAQRGGDLIKDFNGLAKTNPQLAIAMTIFLAALAGVPLTAGFWGKFLVFYMAVNSGLWIAVGIATLSAAAGFYYYFTVIRAMWWTALGSEQPIVVPPISKMCITVLAIAVLVIGIWPQPIWGLLN